MRADIEHLSREYRRSPRVLAGLLEQLIRNMKELRDRQASGDGASALEEFLVLYCIKEPAPPLVYDPTLLELISPEDCAAADRLKSLLGRLGRIYVGPGSSLGASQLKGLLFQLAPTPGPELQLKEMPDFHLVPGEGIAQEILHPGPGEGGPRG